MSIVSTALRFKDIVWYRTVAQLKAETNNNYLGYIWLVLEPAISTAILYLVFGVISGNRSSEMVMFILLGMMIWQWFESSIMMGVNGIREKLHILNNVRMPKFLFPMVNVMANAWKFACVFSVILVLANIVGFHVSVAYLYLPLLFLVQVFLIIGITIPLSICVTYMPDLMNIVASVFRLMFFLSGVFFSREHVPAKLMPYFDLNPVAHLMEAFRGVIIYHEAPTSSVIFFCILAGALPLAIGLALSTWLDKKMIKSVSS